MSLRYLCYLAPNMTSSKLVLNCPIQQYLVQLEIDYNTLVIEVKVRIISNSQSNLTLVEQAAL